MVTYDDFLQTCYDLADSNNASDQVFIQRMGNIGYRRAMRLFGRQFEERTKVTTTVALQQYYQLPIDYSFLKSVTVAVGTYQYPLEEIQSQEEWNNYNRLTSLTNTRPLKYFIRLNSGVGGEEIGLWPTPSAAGNAMTLVYESSPSAVIQPAYTSGTVSASQGSATLTGNGTAFTPSLVGRYFLASPPGGDGQFYRVSSYISATSLLLQNYLEGFSIASAPYGIYDLFGISEEAQMIPVYYTMWHYYLMRQNDTLAGEYKKMHDEDFTRCKDAESTKSRSLVIRRGSAFNTTLDYPMWFPANGISPAS